MKKKYQMPMTNVVNVELESMVAISGGAPVNQVGGNVFNSSVSGGSGSARTKENTYDVWDDDWSGNN